MNGKNAADDGVLVEGHSSVTFGYGTHFLKCLSGAEVRILDAEQVPVE
ncbi:MAG: hypothetical protein ACI9E1_001696 [Cryomorphaceae bacterium]|jgi:hypothetical protein